jgi:hypothetical protein
MPDVSSPDWAMVESELKEKTCLFVYWHLLRSAGSKVGVLKVQRSLAFPVQASHLPIFR